MIIELKGGKTGVKAAIGQWSAPHFRLSSSAFCLRRRIRRRSTAVDTDGISGFAALIRFLKGMVADRPRDGSRGLQPTVRRDDGMPSRSDG